MSMAWPFSLRLSPSLSFSLLVPPSLQFSLLLLPCLPGIITWISARVRLALGTSLEKATL